MKVFEDWFRSLPEYPNIDHDTEMRYREVFDMGSDAVWDEAYRSGYDTAFDTGFDVGYNSFKETALSEVSED